MMPEPGWKIRPMVGNRLRGGGGIDAFPSHSGQAAIRTSGK